MYFVILTQMGLRPKPNYTRLAEGTSGLYVKPLLTVPFLDNCLRKVLFLQRLLLRVFL